MEFFVLKTGPRVVLKTGPSFSLFPVFRVFWGMFKKTQIVSACAKIVFSAKLSGMSKKEMFEKKIAFWVFVFVMLLQDKQKKQNGKRTKTRYK